MRPRGSSGADHSGTAAGASGSRRPSSTRSPTAAWSTDFAMDQLSSGVSTRHRRRRVREARQRAAVALGEDAAVLDDDDGVGVGEHGIVERRRRRAVEDLGARLARGPARRRPRDAVGLRCGRRASTAGARSAMHEPRTGASARPGTLDACGAPSALRPPPPRCDDDDDLGVGARRSPCSVRARSRWSRRSRSCSPRGPRGGGGRPSREPRRPSAVLARAGRRRRRAADPLRAHRRAARHRRGAPA